MDKGNYSFIHVLIQQTNKNLGNIWVSVASTVNSTILALMALFILEMIRRHTINEHIQIMAGNEKCYEEKSNRKKRKKQQKSHLNGVIKEGPSEEVTVEQTPKCTWQSRARCVTPGKRLQEAGAANARALGEQRSWCVWGTARRPLWLDRITGKVKIKDLTPEARSWKALGITMRTLQKTVGREGETTWSQLWKEKTA